METLFFNIPNTVQNVGYHQDTNTTFVYVVDFNDVYRFFENLKSEHKQAGRFVCSKKMEKMSQTFIVAFETINMVVFTFSQDHIKKLNISKFEESNCFNHLFKLIDGSHSINFL